MDMNQDIHVPIVQGSGGVAGQQSRSGSHAPQVHLHAHNVDIEQEMEGPRIVPKDEHVKRDYKELRKLGAIDFSGIVDPTEAEKWLKRTERVFIMIRCVPEEKFDYAVSLLQEDAYDWWETVPDSTVQPPILTWDDFLREFRDKYMPEIYKDEKQREFLTLKQGIMSVAEYEVKFTQLSHYVMVIVSTERDRCRHFEEGLKYDIRSKITPRDLRSYTDLRVAAIRAERLIKEKPTFFQRPKREGSGFSGGFGGRPRKCQNFSLPAQSFTRGSTFVSRGGRSYFFGNANRNQPATMQTKTTCPHCGRQHLGECRGVFGGCYFYGEQGYFVRECPTRVNSGQAALETTVQNRGTRTSFGRGRGKVTSAGGGIGQSDAQSSRAPTHAQVFALTKDEAVVAPEVIIDKVLFNNIEVCVLIDPGSTHSFISSKMTLYMHKNPDTLDSKVNVYTPLGEVVVVDKIYKDGFIQISEAKLYADLIVLSFREFDIIFGMDWLSRHRANVDCYTKEVMIDSLGQNRVLFCGDHQMIPSCLVSALKAFKMIRNGCDAYLAHVVDTNATISKLEDIPVVKEFSEVFPEEFPGMPPDRDT
ncbi:uncharacterized protein LOC141703797 [Apium graveolens]|uniref:uncharacterized protein LOC141703797 n=1 Tax=Apium graveolens TaxID=4045 RepID=UPI003D7B75F7